MGNSNGVLFKGGGCISEAFFNRGFAIYLNHCVSLACILRLD